MVEFRLVDRPLVDGPDDIYAPAYIGGGSKLQYRERQDGDPWSEWQDVPDFFMLD